MNREEEALGFVSVNLESISSSPTSSTSYFDLQFIDGLTFGRNMIKILKVCYSSNTAPSKEGSCTHECFPSIGEEIIMIDKNGPTGFAVFPKGINLSGMKLCKLLKNNGYIIPDHFLKFDKMDTNKEKEEKREEDTDSSSNIDKIEKEEKTSKKTWYHKCCFSF
jgi:hypothetical protein